MRGELITALAPWYAAHVTARGTAGMTTRTELVLGSASPRRREILDRVGIPHRVVVGSADETVLAGEAPAAYLERIALCKLHAVSKALAPELGEKRPAILVADTSVILGQDILGKPEDLADARRMVARLSGRTHEVHTRFAIGSSSSTAPLYAETVVTRVTFRELEPAEIDAYASSGEGTDKAGGYAVQGVASGFVTRIDGSYTNVVGLPAAEVIVALRRLGIVS
jgi:septum formation protein